MAKNDAEFKERRSTLFKHRVVWVLIFIIMLLVSSTVMKYTLGLLFYYLFVDVLPFPILALLLDIVSVVVGAIWATNKLCGRFDL
ncbi:hypothetical protein [Apilactobacillus kunkeei]|uniref:hypothetical protein n=1 Tax=Apilactobacillus kunkeei TaxID=148814 RepID=UPI0006CE97C1|nr:hypothetical protein [Apilactobacillus kunkeei]